MSSWTERARRLKTEMVALSLAVRHPGTPWYAKIFIPLALGIAVKFVADAMLVAIGVAVAL